MRLDQLHHETLYPQKDLEKSPIGGFLCLISQLSIYYSCIIFIIIQEV